MSTNIHDLERLLDDNKVDRLTTVDNRILATLPQPFGLPIVATMIANGRMLELRTIRLLAISPARQARAGRVAAEMNDRYKLAKVAIDARDGELVVMIDLLLADEPLTTLQLRRCLSILGPVAIGGRARLDVLEKTGSDPGPGITDRFLMVAALANLVGAAQQPKHKPSVAKAKLPTGPAKGRPKNLEDLIGDALVAHKDRDKAGPS
jgi:hypothetical protein